MNSLKKLVLLLFAIGVTQLQAQMLDPVKWTFSYQKLTDSTANIILKARIDKSWHLYSQDIPDGGPVPTSFKFVKSKDYQIVGKVNEPKAIEEFDPNFEMKVKYFATQAEFKQKIKVLTDKPFVFKGSLEFMCCDDKQCLPPKEEVFEIKLEGFKPALVASDNPIETEDKIDTISKSKDTSTSITTNKVEDKEKAVIQADEAAKYSGMSLLAFFITAFLSGVVALITPCIYPMIPMTVSYFMHNTKSRRKSITQALVYGLSIIVIYELIGTLVALTLGESFTNWLSTHWAPNIFFFALFLLFAASFFGMFEMTLPSWLVSKSDKQADRGGYFGAFFMAFTLVLVSFSCTAPIVGTILTLSLQGEVIKPVIGMLGFSLAFAIPFTLFAVFPSGLKRLPKSGGWLNAVKVVLGFIELALALKFLSVADQTYHWRILDREVYLALWIVIFSLMGLYLLGKLRFAHDSEFKYLGVPRLLLAVVTFSFVVYMIPGLFGAPLKVLSGWIPPMTTQDFDIGTLVRENAASSTPLNKSAELCEAPRYSEKLKLPHGLKGYYDYHQALACSKEVNKPVFVDFTGHGCVNCRKMEEYVWSNPQVLKRLRENFVIVALYIDDKELMLPENEWYTSSYDGKLKKSLSQKNFDLQKSKFNANAQPYYVILDSEGNPLSGESKGFDTDINAFIKFLDDGFQEFKKKNL